MQSIKEEVFGEKGYSSEVSLSHDELTSFRALVAEQWLDTIRHAHPELEEEAKSLGLPNYHLLADKLDHKGLWPKSSRVLPKKSVEVVKSLPFIKKLKAEFGEFEISDVYDTYQHHGEEEVYWRLVRPGAGTDVGALHNDKWFHESFNDGNGMFPPGVTTVKIWLPLYCEPGKNGLSLVEGSHLKKWNYHLENIGGTLKPLPDDDLSNVGARLIPTEPGNMLLFNENTLHGGVVNQGSYTRVSVEITLVLPAAVSQLH